MEDNNKNSNIEELDNNEHQDVGKQPLHADETHLRSYGFAPSESNTTNIPPRLPVGYAYTSSSQSQAETDDLEPQEPLVNTDQPHPDLPKDRNDLRSIDDIEASVSVKVKRPRHRVVKVKKAIKRYGLWVLLIIVIVAVGVTYPYWRNYMGNWNNAEPEPAVAADTVPVVPKQPIDTTPPGLTHEDSMRIQDSVRHARWLYWQRRKRAEKAQKQEEENQAEAPSSATNSEHNATHSDSIK